MLNHAHLRELLARHGNCLEAPIQPFELGGRSVDFDRQPLLMGVINLSPDSAYAESVCRTPREAIARGRLLVDQGAALVDIGAESSLPHAARVSARVQMERLLPVVRALVQKNVLVSVESYHAEVLDAAAEAGAGIFNLTGAVEEAAVFRIARRFGTAVVLCYVQGDTVRDVGAYSFVADMMDEMLASFAKRTRVARDAGVNRLILDPGLGFYYRNLQDGALRVNHQLNTFMQSFRLRPLGYPVLNVLPHAPEIFGEPHRRSAEPFFGVLAMLGGTQIIRTHEVEALSRIRAAMALFQPEPGHSG